MAVAAIFDLDGTLVTFNFDVQGTRKVLLEEMEKRGFDTSGLNLTTPTQNLLDAARIQLPEKGEAAYNDLHRSFFEILDRFELESARSTVPFPGIAADLRFLRSGGVRMAVLTNSGRKAAFESLRKAGLQEYFEFILTRDDTETMKPRPEGVAKAASLLGLPKASVYYVGDSPYDIAAAKRAGMKVVSVATGNYSADRLRKEGADYVISSISELRGILGV
jgi:HAD superfamily hydrolase (TIGR01509 family)